MLRPFRPAEAARATAYWNRFWAGTVRAFPVTTEDFLRRVVAVPGWEETQLLLTDNGFVHFGPREPWWFRVEERRAVDRTTGMIYALCAEDEGERLALLQEAETSLHAEGAERIWLWPTWAQGTIPFYTGMTPSNEISGLWEGSPLVAWAERQGYRVAVRYRLGILEPLSRVISPELPPGCEAVWEDFVTPLLPGAKRLILRRGGERIAHVIAVESVERNRDLGTSEWAAYDVAVDAAHRGQGWGRALMRSLVKCVVREGATSVQLHMVQGNMPAENLYFRSMGFAPLPEGGFISLEKARG